jgi:hypothetical protein
MKEINRDLRKELERRTGLGWRQVYRRIQAKVAETRLDPHLAALLLASEHGIALSKYATSDDLASLRGLQKAQPLPVGAQPVPVTPAQPLPAERLPKVNLSKVRRKHLRDIIRRDLNELGAVISLDLKFTSKTCMILCGSIGEALLLDALLRKKTKALKASGTLPKNPGPKLESWDLYEMVQVAVAMTPPLLPPDIEASAQQLRRWRNLVHPGNELRETKKNRIRPTPTRARSALGFLQLISDELYAKKTKVA